MEVSGLPLDELAQLLYPLPRFRAAQIFKWIAAGVSSFDEMSNVSLPLRKELAGRFSLRPAVTVTKHSANDGTIKLALRFQDGATVEAVLLSDNRGRCTVPSAVRHTVCISTQLGCPANCVFCKTGAMGFVRDLSSAEIVEQFLQLRKVAAENNADDSSPGPEAPPAAVPVSNIVVMGMGEPLLNLPELRRALAVISCKQGLGLSPRRITVSTCGIAEGVIDLADNGPAIRLALSLTTGDEDLRARLMPITRGQGLAKVKDSLRYFQKRGGGRITLEAVLLGGVNTRGEDAESIADFAEGIDAVVNIIPWNRVKGLQFEGRPLREPSAAEIESFIRHLEALELNVTRRYRRGRGVMGACGQLGISN